MRKAKKRIPYALLIGLFPMLSLSASAAKSGGCGANAQWRFANGVLTISGTGPMADYSHAERPTWEWQGLKIRFVSVVIGDGITHIGDFSFDGCISLTEISISSTRESIGERAFSKCAALTEPEIPDTVTTLGEAILFECRNLRNLKLSKGATVIPMGFAVSCNSLRNPVIPLRRKTL